MHLLHAGLYWAAQSRKEKDSMASEIKQALQDVRRRLNQIKEYL